MNRFKLSKLQDFVAESLQMQRGKNYLIDKSSKRLDTHEFKASKKLENEIEKETNKRLKNQKEKIQLQVNEYVSKTNITQKELKEEINKLRAELKENKATKTKEA
jgi:transcriptional regulator NrdR family protein